MKEALGGTRQDFTEGSLSRGIALLAIPTVLLLKKTEVKGPIAAH